MVETHKQAVKRGKKNRASGAAFEKRVREDLEEKGWIVDKFNNNVDLENNKLIIAKNKWSGPGRPMMLGAGFPDFLCFKQSIGLSGALGLYEVIGVESKVAGRLSKIEKEKCKWLLDNNIFGKILIAEKTKVKNKIVVKYKEFKNGS